MSVSCQQLPQDVWLVTVSGRLDHNLSPDMEQQLVDLLSQEKYFIIVDLSGVTYINSGGLRCLVSAWRQARSQQGDVLLFGLNARVQSIFSMIGFDEVFRIFATQAEAESQIAALKAAGG